MQTATQFIRSIHNIKTGSKIKTFGVIAQRPGGLFLFNEKGQAVGTGTRYNLGLKAINARMTIVGRNSPKAEAIAAAAKIQLAEVLV